MSAPLAKQQEAFLRAILDENAPAPQGWGNSQAAGMAVYRGNYRSALTGALAETYESTGRYLGEKLFSRARINHIIKHPPSGWTIDEAGAGFDLTCASMFADNPEVAELAWIEWTMLQLATAPDSEAITQDAFAAALADIAVEDQGNIKLDFQPRAKARLVNHDMTALWKALAAEGGEQPDIALAEPQSCLVWREGERPTFILLEADHAHAFNAMQQGASYGEMIGVLLVEDGDPAPKAIQEAAMRAGAILGKWLQEGLVIGLNP